MIAEILIACPVLVYGAFLLVMAMLFHNKREFIPRAGHTYTGFSVCIAFRNEEKNLAALLGSLKKLDYPGQAVEFVFCDDHSADGSRQVLEHALKDFQFEYRILSLEEKKGKKAAMSAAINAANKEFILCTDADCLLPANWLQAFNAFILAHPKAQCIPGPVSFDKTGDSVISAYQELENSGLILIAAASLWMGRPVMANGANFCFRREVFAALGGYEGNEDIPTGDDVFLLQKIHEKYPGACYFLKSKAALVTTAVCGDYASFMEQRLRWASKNFAAKNPSSFAMQLFLAGIFLAMLLSIPLSLVGLLHPAICLLWPFKIGVDLLFFRALKRFFDCRVGVKDQILVSVLQVLFIPWIGLQSVFSGYAWKGRIFRK